nr:adenylate cyclase [Hymenolepis microstoma]
MQYVVYRLNKVAGVIPCEEEETFCNGTSNGTKFEGMDKLAKDQWVQSQSAYLSTAMSLVSGIVGLVTIIPLGFISDRFGRKVGLYIAYLGFAIESVMIALVILLHLPLWVLVVATLPSSILGNGICGILTQIFVCITDLTEQKAEVLERKLSIVPTTEGEIFSVQPRRRSRASSIMERSEPKSLATVQSTMTAERLSYIALFEGVIGITMAICTMTMGSAISKFGFQFPAWFMLGLVVVNLVLTALMPNTKVLWDTSARKSSIKPKELDVKTRKNLLLSISEKGESRDSQNPVVVVTPPEPKKKTSCCTTLKQAFSFVTVPITIGIIANLLANMIAHTDMPVLNLYFIGDPFGMSISQVGVALGVRTIGCSIVSGIFVLFNMFYLQPRLATPNVKHMKLKRAKNCSESSSDNVEEDAQGFTAAEIETERISKVLEGRRIMLIGLSALFLVMAISKFLYGIASSFPKPTCMILLFSGMLLNAFQFFGPLVRALLSGLVSCEVQGRLYALIGFGDSLGTFIGMTSLPVLFASTIFMNAGFVFHMATLVLGFAFILNGVNIYLLLYGKYK